MNQKSVGARVPPGSTGEFTLLQMPSWIWVGQKGGKSRQGKGRNIEGKERISLDFAFISAY